MSWLVHAVHIVLAGIWLGGVVFTTVVVSPALKAVRWSEPERILVRSKIGKQYAKVGSINLVLLALFALLDGFIAGFGAAFYAEYLLIAVLFGLVAVHGAYFGRRLRELAEAEKSAGSEEALGRQRRDLQVASLRVSVVNLLVSLAVALLAVGS